MSTTYILGSTKKTVATNLSSWSVIFMVHHHDFDNATQWSHLLPSSLETFDVALLPYNVETNYIVLDKAVYYVSKDKPIIETRRRESCRPIYS